jgi:hypothetical protein
MYWSHLDYRRSMQLYKIAITKYYFVGDFLSNCICLCQGNITSNYFRMKDDEFLTLEQYFNMVSGELLEQLLQQEEQQHD